MNRRAFLGSGLASLFVGVFALLMGGLGLPIPRREKQGPRKVEYFPGRERVLEGHPLKSWDGKPLQEAGTMAFSMHGTEGIEAFKEAWREACSGQGYAVPWDAPTKATPLADMRRTRNIGRQFGLG